MRFVFNVFSAGVFAVLMAYAHKSVAQNTLPIDIVPQVGHSSGLYSAVFSPDGRFILTGSADTTLILWDVSTGKELRRFRGHADSVSSVSFSPDGRSALSGSADKTVRLWDIATGNELRAFRGHSKSVTSISFSPDGRLALSAGSDSVIKLWDVATGKELRAFIGHTDSVLSVAFAPNGLRILSGGSDRTVRLWDLTSGAEIRNFSGQLTEISSVAFSPDGRFGLAANCAALSKRYTNKCDRGALRLWELESGKVRDLGGDFLESQFGGVKSIAVSPDGRFAISGGFDNTLRLWDLNTGKQIRSFEGHGHTVFSVAFSPDSSLALSASWDKTLMLWDVATGKNLRTLTAHSSAVNSIAFSPDGRSILAGRQDGTITASELATGRTLRVFRGHTSPIQSVAVSPDGKLALSGGCKEDLNYWLRSCGSGVVKLWDMKSGSKLRDFEGHKSLVSSVAFSPDGSLVLAGGCSAKARGNNQLCLRGSVKLWETATGKERYDLQAHSGEVTSVTFSPDGRVALSGSWDSSMGYTDREVLVLWDLTSGTKMHNFDGVRGSVTSVAFSPDGRLALSVSADTRLDSQITLWDVSTRKMLRNFDQGPDGTAATFSRDGRFIISGGNKIKLWEATTGKELSHFGSDAGSLGLSPDGRFVLSGGRDGTIRIWNKEKGEELGRMMAQSDGEWLTITPAGFFATSNAAANLLNVVRGVEGFSVLQFYDHLSRPDLLEELLKGDPWGKYKDAASKLKLETILNSGPAPKLELLEKRTERTGDSVKFSVRIKDAGGGIGGKVVWRVNGKTQGDLTASGLQGPPSPGRAVVMNQELRVDPGNSNLVEVTAYNGQSLLASLPLQVTVDPFGVTTTERPKLHVLAVGVDKYAMKDLELRYAVKDAKAFAEAMQSVGSTLFSEVKITALHDGEVTKAKLEAAVNKLAGEVKPTDVFVLFLSGHGRSIAGKYYFLQQDLEFTKGQSIERDAVSQDLWQAWLAKIPAQKTLLIYDTCESGAAAGLVKGGERERETAMEQLQHATGQNLIAAARQAAYEGYEGHGVLTYAMLEAFQKLDAGGGEVEKVDVDGLARYVGDKVPELTKVLYGVRQEPVRKLAGNNFPLGLRILSAATSSECPATEDFVIVKSGPSHENPDEKAQSKRTLAPGFRVGAKLSGGWALICRDGVSLGYVKQESIAKTN